MKTYKKIDLFFNGDYLCTTAQSKTCREAIAKYLDRVNRSDFYNTLVDSRIKKHPKLLKARFQK